MCDVLFITPNTTADMAGEVVGPLILTTLLESQGIACQILQFCRIGDVNRFADFLDAAVKAVQERKPKIVSFYTRCDAYHIQIRMAQRIKATFPSVYVVFGGPQSDITAEDTLRHISAVDFICCGEGETTAYPFFSSLLQGTPDLTVDGLVYRQGENICKNPRPQLVTDLDSLPMIDYSRFWFDETKVPEAERKFPIDVGRGCPFGCTYCSTNSFWGRKFRVKSPQRICQEIQELHQRFGISRFGFSHDMFTVNRNKVIETCRRIKELDFPIWWSCSARLDCIDQELIDIMADSGMVSIFIGIETGSPRMQKLINKNLKLTNAVSLIRYLQEKKISTTASFIYGFPEETEEDISATVALMGKLMQLGHVKIQAHLCTFLAGTELSQRYHHLMTPTESYSDITGEYAITECRDMFRQYPEIFPHMLEYRTPFRTRLKYFKTFINMWYIMQPVYQYLSEKYPEDRLIDMYYDFVEANRDLLEQLDGIEKSQRARWMRQRDRFPGNFQDDPCYHRILDLLRYWELSNSDAVQKGENVSDMFCFDPRQVGKVPLQDYRECVAVVSWYDKKQHIAVYQ